MSQFTKVATVTAVVFGFALGFLWLHSESRAAEPPDNVTIKVIQDKKSPVDFPHKAHAPRLVDKCGNCHANAAAPDKTLKPELTAKPANMAEALKHPFHTECKDCHTKEGKGPKGCTECHK